jgi:hypothetical protein
LTRRSFGDDDVARASRDIVIAHRRAMIEVAIVMRKSRLS